MRRHEAMRRDRILRDLFNGKDWDRNEEFMLKRSLVLRSAELLPGYPFLGRSRHLPPHPPQRAPAHHSRGSTGSASNANTPTAHTNTSPGDRRSTNRCSASTPSANSLIASPRLVPTPRSRSRGRW
jgi:hypothetical protein